MTKLGIRASQNIHSRFFFTTRFSSVFSSLALRFFIVLLPIACSASYPDGEYQCGKNGICPPGLTCGKDNLCWRKPPTEESEDTGDRDDASDTYTQQAAGSKPDSKAGDDAIGITGGKGGSERNSETGGSATPGSGGKSAEPSEERSSESDSGASENTGGTRGDNSGDSNGGAESGTDGSSGSNGGAGSEVNRDRSLYYDTSTGLIWQKCSAGQSGEDCLTDTATAYDWEDAKAFCETLTLGDFSDWRLPTIHELISIIDYSTAKPAIDTTVFPATPKVAGYWSSSGYVDASLRSSGRAWGVNFTDGLVDNNTSTMKAAVRCVRGKELGLGQFTVIESPDGNIVSDPSTGLTWLACPIGRSGGGCASGTGTLFNSPDAVDSCRTLNARGYAGYNDWRLPNLKELISIVDYSKNSPAIDGDAFPNTANVGFWSSTTTAESSELAWGVDFTNGYAAYNVLFFPANARCVRGGP
ncbi:MAG: DUF1566 domain-containing protein [Deltaproteobacteria bacterium]|nr:DUF1566 domain-containing protein [Deltaproteobacteria bacterium]